MHATPPRIRRDSPLQPLQPLLSLSLSTSDQDDEIEVRRSIVGERRKRKKGMARFLIVTRMVEEVGKLGVSVEGKLTPVV